MNLYMNSAKLKTFGFFSLNLEFQKIFSFLLLVYDVAFGLV